MCFCSGVIPQQQQQPLVSSCAVSVKSGAGHCAKLVKWRGVSGGIVAVTYILKMETGGYPSLDDLFTLSRIFEFSPMNGRACSMKTTKE